MHQASYMISMGTNGSNKQAVLGSVQYAAYWVCHFFTSDRCISLKNDGKAESAWQAIT